MKRTVVTILALIFSISFCMAQNIREAAEQQKQQEAQQQAIERQRQAAEQQKRREAEFRYQEKIKSAESNFNQQQYEQAKRDYMDARELKPGNAASINPKIAEIDSILLIKEREHEEAENEHKYQDAIASAESNFEQQRYAQAIQDYTTALELKPGNAASINAKIAEIDKKMNEPALLYIYRMRKPFLERTILPIRYDVLLDNVVVGRTANNWKTAVPVNTLNTKTLSATIDGKAEVQIDFEPGGVYYIRCDVSSETIETGEIRTIKNKDGTTSKRPVTKILHTPILQLVDKNIGESEFNSIVVK